MTIQASAEQVRDVAVVFPLGSEETYGILTEPARGPAETTVVLLKGGGFAPMIHRNRIWVRLARRLAGEGFSVLRFEYHGIGEATGTPPKFLLSHPFVEDVEAALRWLRGVGRGQGIMLVGTCFGARTALAAAHRIPELRGAVLWALPLWDDGDLAAVRMASQLTLRGQIRRGLRRDVFRRMFDRERREVYIRMVGSILQRMVIRALRVGRRQPPERHLASPRVLEQIRGIARRGIPVTFLYGRAEDYYEEFKRSLSGELGEIFAATDGAFDVRTVSGTLHVMSSVDAQNAAIDLTIKAICRFRDRLPPERTESTQLRDSGT